jgi:PAS domain S-box-containing protein
MLTKWRWITAAILVGVLVAGLSVILLPGGSHRARVDATGVLGVLLLAFLIIPSLYLPKERLSAQLAAASACASFRAVVAAVSDAIIASDRRGRICYVNPATRDLLGYTEDDLLGGDMVLLVPEDQRQCYLEGLRNLVETKEGRIVGHGPKRMEVLAKGGKRVPVELTLSAVALSIEGLLVVVIRDLSARTGLYRTMIPVCSACGLIRDDTGAEHGQGRWGSLEEYVRRRAAASFTHGYCPECLDKVKRENEAPFGC